MCKPIFFTRAPRKPGNDCRTSLIVILTSTLLEQQRLMLSMRSHTTWQSKPESGFNACMNQLPDCASLKRKLRLTVWLLTVLCCTGKNSAQEPVQLASAEARGTEDRQPVWHHGHGHGHCSKPGDQVLQLWRDLPGQRPSAGRKVGGAVMFID